MNRIIITYINLLSKKLKINMFEMDVWTFWNYRKASLYFFVRFYEENIIQFCTIYTYAFICKP